MTLRQVPRRLSLAFGTVRAQFGAARVPRMSIPERRRSPRFPTELAVEYGTAHEFASGKIVDVGVAGFGILGHHTYPPGSQLELRFHIPENGDEMRIKAVVCFSSRNRMGVQVISVPAEGLKLLERIYDRISHPS